MKAVHLHISGRVQGVGYRAWTVSEARKRGLDGWVRNRTNGGVEALIAGPIDQVDGLLADCRRGPPAARVDAVEVGAANPPGKAGFRARATL